METLSLEEKKHLQNYLFLSNEMLKFIDSDNLNLLTDLFRQREDILQKLIVSENLKQYMKSKEGQVFFEQISELDKKIRLQLVTEFNKFKQSFDLSNAYEGIWGNNVTIGNSFDSNNH